MEFRLLGRVEATDEHRAIHLGRRRERALLAVLLLEAGRVVPTERLIDLLWDGGPPETARASLRTHVSRLRTRLDSTAVALVAKDGGYLADVDPDSVDAHRFRSLVERAQATDDPGARAQTLRQALDLWRGPLLDDLDDARLRDRVGADLADLRLSATESMIDAELACGQHERLAGELAVLCAEHPHRERLAAQLILALWRSARHADALARYETVRRRLADDLGADPGPELQRLYQAMLRQDPGLALDAPPARADPAPAQLPAAPTYFTGREGMLADLDALLSADDVERGPVIVSAIAGAAGVGKTSVAVHWARRVAQRFPDGQLYVNLRGYDPTEPVRTEAALEGFLRALGVPPARLPSRLDDLAAMYRTVLAGRRVLVLLDNARSADQVRPLLPAGDTCFAVVTSRNDLSGLMVRDGARRLLLGYLPGAEALALFARIVGAARVSAERDAAEQLVWLCGGLPLAIRIAAQRSVVFPDVPLAVLAEELADEGRRLESLQLGDDPTAAVRAVLSWSYQPLSAAAARLFRLLGLLPTAEVTVPAAARLADVPEATVARAVVELAEAHLLERAADRWQLHDLVRLYASERAAVEETPAECSAATRRVLMWYLGTATAAAKTINANRKHPELPSDAVASRTFATYEEALSWLDAERGGIVAAVNLAARSDEHEAAWKLTVALWDLFNVRDYWVDWIGSHRVALRSCERLGDQAAESWILNHLAPGYGRSGRYHEAADCLRRALAIRQATGNRRGEAPILHNLGVACQHLGQLDDAMTYFRDALDRYGDHASGRGSALNSIGAIHQERGEYGPAADSQRQALECFRAAEFAFGEADALTDLSHARRGLGDHDDALTHADAALELARRIGHSFGQARALDALAHAHVRTEEPGKARQEWTAALDILRELNDPMQFEVEANLTGLR